MKIYLAGKIGHTDWRHNIVPDLRANNAATDPWDDPQLLLGWKPMPGAMIGGHDYVGPFFISDDHGCAHGRHSHGVGLDRHAACFNPPHSRTVLTRCMDSIYATDAVFAWIDSPDAYGTVAEIGMALVLGKKIYIAGPDRYPDMWFVYESASRSGGSVTFAFQDALSAFKALIAPAIPTLESPVEERFWNAWLAIEGLDVSLIPQVEVFDGRYRLDFAVPEHKIGIEIDGYEFHSGKEQFTKDRKRQRTIERAGWRLIRYSGQEVFHHARECAHDAYDTISEWINGAS